VAVADASSSTKPVPRRRFGATGLTVSAIGVGCARIGGVFDRTDRASHLRLLRRALDRGITFFDTSDLYGHGESERLLGEALKGLRSRAIIATKLGYRLPMQTSLASRVRPLLRPLLRRVGISRERVPLAIRGRASQDFSPGYVVQAAERSLKRLGTDYIDLYQLHSPPRGVLEDGGFVEPLERLKAAGKIRHWGISCETSDDALLALRHSGSASLQVLLNVLDPAALAEVIPRAADAGVALIVRQCFAGGLLTRDYAAADLERLVPDRGERDGIVRLRRIAEERGRRLSELALQFAVGAPSVSVALVGVSSEAHLEEALRDLDAPPLDAFERDAVLGLAGLTSPAPGAATL